MAKQKKTDELNLDLSELFSEAEKAISTIAESPSPDELDFELELELEPPSSMNITEEEEVFVPEASDELDLDAELAALEGKPKVLSEVDILRADLKKAKKIIRLQKQKLSLPPPVQVDPKELQSLNEEITQLKARIKDGHRAQLDQSKQIQELENKCQEESERVQQFRKSYSSMRKKAEELKSTAEQLQTRLRRVQDRRKKEAEENKNFGVTPAVKALIPAIENLERSLQFSDVTQETLKKGIQMALVQLYANLAKIGVNRVNTERGSEFDPTVHEAVQRIPSVDVQAGCIVEEVAAGFILNGRLIRAAKVGVAVTLEGSAEVEEHTAEEQIQEPETSVPTPDENVQETNAYIPTADEPEPIIEQTTDVDLQQEQPPIMELEPTEESEISSALPDAADLAPAISDVPPESDDHSEE